MTDYSQFKCQFCDCCKTGCDETCCLHWANASHIRGCYDFINWEAVMGTKPYPDHDKPRCDIIYIRQNNETVYFIEQKNVIWLLCDSQNAILKDIKDVAHNLKNKFKHSKEIFEKDGNQVKYFKFIFSYDMNGIPNSAELERLFRTHIFTPLEQFDIISNNCENAFYYIVYC